MSSTPETPMPAWYDPDNVILELDATALMAAGEHPKARVLAAAAASTPGEIVALRSAFRPEPLILILQADGFQVWCGQQAGLFRTFICKSH